MRVGYLKHIKMTIALALCIQSAHATTIATSRFPNILSDKFEQQGPFNVFLDSLENAYVAFFPTLRAENNFRNRQFDCLFPASIAGLHNPEQLIESTPIQSASAFLFSTSPNLSIVKSTTIGIRRGFSYNNIREKLNGHFIELQDDFDAVRLLDSGRVEAVIGFLPDIAAAYSAINKQLPYYDVNAPISSNEDAMVCHKTPENMVFIASVNKKIETFKLQFPAFSQ